MKRLDAGVLWMTMVAGCASLQGMQPAHLDVASKSSASANIEIEMAQVPTEDSEVHWMLQEIQYAPLSMEEFGNALHDSVLAGGLFGSFDDSDASDYMLTVTVRDYTNKRGGGVAILARQLGAMTTEWALQRKGNPTPVYSDVVNATAEASLLEAFNARRVAELVRERLIRGTISSGIRRLGRVDRPPLSGAP